MTNKNNNNLFFTILSLSIPRLWNESFNIIASSHYLPNGISLPFSITSQGLADKLDKVYDNKLKIILIDDSVTKIGTSKIGNSISNDYTVFVYPPDLFFTKDNIVNVLIKNKDIHQFIFIFKNKDYGDIVAHLALFNIILSGGSNTKKHILSPVQLRLARFLIAIVSFTGDSVSKSFHYNRKEGKAGMDWSSKDAKEAVKIFSGQNNLHKEDTFSFNSEPISVSTRLVRDQPLPIWLQANGREGSKGNRNFHTTSCFSKPRAPFGQGKLKNYPINSLWSLQNRVGTIEVAPIPVKTINTKSALSFDQSRAKGEDNTILSYLDSIKIIINNPENSPEKAQSLIENTWLSILLNQLNDENKLINKYSHRFSNIILEANKTLNSLQENNLIKRKFPMLYKDLNDINYIFITYTFCLSYSNKLGYTSLVDLIGNNILYQIFKKSDMTNFSDFKNQFKDSNLISYKVGDFFITLLTQFPHDLFERNISPSSDYTKEVAILNINSEYLEDIKNNIIVHPYTLPMVCKPNLWSEDSFGGFLDNINKEVPIITGSHQHAHLVENKEALFKTANYLNSIKFGINNTLLNYIKNEGKFFLEEIKGDSDTQRIITFKIAESFSNIPFYLNVHADWRGRIYTQSFFLTYQGGVLSTALLNFWEGTSLTKAGKLYLYIHGANNHNESNISKESFEKRINWVKNNYLKIINLDKSLILSAEKPFIFLAFCLNMRELHNNPNAIINTPVFLDATCSGIQHLSALLLDLELGISVNLTPYNQEDGPNDIYSDLLSPINKAINKYGEENYKFSSLSLIELNRKIIKTSIMTKVYNVSQYGIAKQIESRLEIKEDDYADIDQISTDLSKSLKLNKRLNVYSAPGRDSIPVYLNKADIFKIAEIINNQIFVIFPSLNNIYSYFIETAKIMVKLGIPITWITPSGLKITQHYLKSKQTVISTKLLKRSKKMIIRESLNEVDKLKQTNSIIPNIIHSLDATHLINLINKALDQRFAPILTIHDCFGTLPNKMEELGFMLKKEFILLYSQKNFLETYHNRLIQSIKDNKYAVVFSKENNCNYVILENNWIKIPNIPNLGDLDLKKIIDSKYMVS